MTIHEQHGLQTPGWALAIMGVSLAAGALWVVVQWFSMGSLGPSLTREADIESAWLANFVEQYYVYVGEYPASLDDLVNPPEGVTRFTAEIPDDPWGDPYTYTVEGGRFEVCSLARAYDPICAGNLDRRR